SLLIKPYAAFVAARVQHWSRGAVSCQQQIFEKIIRQATQTQVGKEHLFSQIKSYEDFKKAVRLRDYEQLKSYFDKIVEGEENVLWKGKPKYLAKTSGTTSGVKYIPITHHSIGNHFYSAQTAMMLFMHEQHDTSLMDGKMIFLSGSPELETKNGIKTGRLS